MKHVRSVTKLPKSAQDLWDFIDLNLPDKTYDPLQQLFIVLTKGQAV